MTPLVDGSFDIRALDLCLEVTEQPRSEIHISGVSSIQLNVVDKVKYAFVDGILHTKGRANVNCLFSDVICYIIYVIQHRLN